MLSFLFPPPLLPPINHLAALWWLPINRFFGPLTISGEGGHDVEPLASVNERVEGMWRQVSEEMRAAEADAATGAEVVDWEAVRVLLGDVTSSVSSGVRRCVGGVRICSDSKGKITRWGSVTRADAIADEGSHAHSHQAEDSGETSWPLRNLDRDDNVNLLLKSSFLPPALSTALVPNSARLKGVEIHEVR